MADLKISLASGIDSQKVEFVTPDNYTPLHLEREGRALFAWLYRHIPSDVFGELVRACRTYSETEDLNNEELLDSFCQRYIEDLKDLTREESAE